MKLLPVRDKPGSNYREQLTPPKRGLVPRRSAAGWLRPPSEQIWNFRIEYSLEYVTHP